MLIKIVFFALVAFAYGQAGNNKKKDEPYIRVSKTNVGLYGGSAGRIKVSKVNVLIDKGLDGRFDDATLDDIIKLETGDNFRISTLMKLIGEGKKKSRYSRKNKQRREQEHQISKRLNKIDSDVTTEPKIEHQNRPVEQGTTSKTKKSEPPKGRNDKGGTAKKEKGSCAQKKNCPVNQSPSVKGDSGRKKYDDNSKREISLGRRSGTMETPQNNVEPGSINSNSNSGSGFLTGLGNGAGKVLSGLGTIVNSGAKVGSDRINAARKLSNTGMGLLDNVGRVVNQGLNKANFPASNNPGGNINDGSGGVGENNVNYSRVRVDIFPIEGEEDYNIGGNNTEKKAAKQNEEDYNIGGNNTEKKAAKQEQEIYLTNFTHRRCEKNQTSLGTTSRYCSNPNGMEHLFTIPPVCCGLEYECEFCVEYTETNKLKIQTSSMNRLRDCRCEENFFKCLVVNAGLQKIQPILLFVRDKCAIKKFRQTAIPEIGYKLVNAASFILYPLYD